MSPFIQNGIGLVDSMVLDNEEDDIYNDVVENTTLANASLDESLDLTDNKKLIDKLQLQDSEIGNLKQQLNYKAKQLDALNGHLEQMKVNLAQYSDRARSNLDLTEAVFKDTKTFNAKVGHEIRQKLSPLGFELEYLLVDDQVTLKIQKDGKWFEIGLNDQLRLVLLNMSPRHNRFDEIKELFDSTRNFNGLFSIYNWSLSKLKS